MVDDEIGANSSEESAGAPAWVMTFADLMSLLMCFFVLLLSFSEMDVQKFKQIAGSMKMAFGVQREVRAHEIPKGTSIISKEFSPAKPQKTILNEVRQVTSNDTRRILASKQAILTLVKADARQIAKLLGQEIKDGQVEVETQGNKIVIRILEKGSFPSGMAELSEEFMPVISKIKKAVVSVKGSVKIAGHTDDKPIATTRFRSNWELSASRAVSVAHAILEKGGIASNRVEITGFGDTRPRFPNDNDENRAKNRRVDIIIVQDPTSLLKKTKTKGRKVEGKQNKPLNKNEIQSNKPQANKTTSNLKSDKQT